MLKLISIVNTVVIVWLLLSIDSLSGRVYGLQQRGVPAGAVDDGGDAAEQPEVDGERAAQPKAATVKTSSAPVELSDERMVALGERIFLTQGSNTCNDCHGTAGYGGRLPEAPDLRRPTTWKAYKTAKGDLAAMAGPVTEVIRYGGGVWNSKHPEPVYDVTMLGVVQGATKTTLRKIRKELKKSDKLVMSMDDSLDLGARATYAYLQTLWIDEGSAPGTDAAPQPAGTPASPTADAPAADG
jgi:mono/diheme cytochrome c family protein